MKIINVFMCKKNSCIKSKKKVTINDNFVYFFIDTMKLICYNEDNERILPHKSKGVIV